MKKLFATVCLAAVSFGGLSESFGEGLRVGAINWDCSVPATTFFGGYQTRSLGPEKFRDRTPYYAKIAGRDRIDYPVRTLAEYEVEMRYAIEAGLDYFAYCWYDRTSVKGRHLVQGAVATADEHVYELTNARRFHLQSELRRDLGLCAILVTCHPYSDDALNALVAAMKDDAYEKVGGRPLVYLFERQWKPLIPRLRRLCREAGVEHPFFVVMANGDVPPGDYSDVDAFSAYACTSSQSNYEALAADSLVRNAARAKHGKPIVPTWTVGWDPSPRVENPVPWCSYRTGPYHAPATGSQLLEAAEDVAKWIKANASACVPNQVLTFAWNEFEEGGWICPSIRSDGTPELTRLSDFAKSVRAMKGLPPDADITFEGAGGKARINPFGAVLTSWKPHASGEVLAMARDFEGCGREIEIHGGIPICWPWAVYTCPETAKVHFITRSFDWKVKTRTTDSVVMAFDDTEETRRVWPHKFHLELEYRLNEPETLTAEFRATNTGDQPYACTELFHPYLRVGDTAKTTISNTKGLHYFWKREREFGESRTLSEDFCGARFKDCGPGYIISEVGDGPHRHDLVDPVLGRRIEITYEGGCKLVTWNSGPDFSVCGTSDLPDFGRRFLCVETGNLYDDRAYTLKPGETHVIKAKFQVKGL